MGKDQTFWHRLPCLCAANFKDRLLCIYPDQGCAAIRHAPNQTLMVVPPRLGDSVANVAGVAM